MFLSKIQGSPSLELVSLVLEKKARGEKVISLAIGDPSFNTPPEIIEEAYKSMTRGDVHYVSSYGTIEVRDSIRRKVHRKNGINAELGNCIFMTTKLSVYASLVSITESGHEEILVPDPGYFYSEPVYLAGGIPVYYSLSSGFSLDIEEIKKNTTSKTRAIIINSPSNPTGKVLERSELSELYDFCIERGIYIISDEAYEDLSYEKTHFSIGGLEKAPDIVISLFSLSKSYSMTGWRSGYVAANSKLIQSINKFVENTVSCLPPFIEAASAFALNNCDNRILEFKNSYRERRDFMIEKIREIKGLEVGEVEGAFYAFPRYTGHCGSVELVKDLLKKENVALLPGVSFGPSGENHVRLSFSGSMEDIGEGLKRMKIYFSTQS